MIVQIKSKDPDYPDLSEGQPYFVIGIEADHYRILNNEGKPYLYPPEIFNVLDSDEPVDWVTEIGEDGERYSYPEPLNEIGFFEDFFDHKVERISTFWNTVNRRLSTAA